MSKGTMSSCRSCNSNIEDNQKEVDECGDGAMNLTASVDFAEFTPHILVCESPGHCRYSKISQTVEDSI